MQLSWQSLSRFASVKSRLQLGRLGSRDGSFRGEPQYPTVWIPRPRDYPSKLRSADYEALRARIHYRRSLVAAVIGFPALDFVLQPARSKAPSIAHFRRRVFGLWQ